MLSGSMKLSSGQSYPRPSPVVAARSVRKKRFQGEVAICAIVTVCICACVEPIKEHETYDDVTDVLRSMQVKIGLPEDTRIIYQESIGTYRTWVLHSSASLNLPSECFATTMTGTSVENVLVTWLGRERVGVAARREYPSYFWANDTWKFVGYGLETEKGFFLWLERDKAE